MFHRQKEHGHECAYRQVRVWVGMFMYARWQKISIFFMYFFIHWGDDNSFLLSYGSWELKLIKNICSQETKNCSQFEPIFSHFLNSLFFSIISFSFLLPDVVISWNLRNIHWMKGALSNGFCYWSFWIRYGCRSCFDQSFVVRAL